MRERLRRPKIRKRNGKFIFRITDSLGKQRQYSFLSAFEAESKLEDFLRQVQGMTGKEPILPLDLENGFAFFLKTKTKLKPNSRVRYNERTANWLKFFKDNHSEVAEWAKIKQEHLLEYVDWRRSMGRANKTINADCNHLTTAFETLVKFKKIPENIQIPKLPEPLVNEPVRIGKSLSPEELSRFFQQAEKSSKEINWYVIFQILYICGNRVSEIINANVSDIEESPQGYEWAIPKTKTGKQKKIPIHPQIQQYFKEALQKAKESGSNILFPNNEGNRLNRNKIRDRFIEICKLAGIKTHHTTHDLRRTFASRTELSIETRRSIGGWESIEVMNETYNLPAEKVIRDDYFRVKFTK